MRPSHAFAAALLAATAGSAAAQAPTPSDASCLLVSNIFAKQSTGATQKARAQNVLFYYFGRLDGRYNAAQLKDELKAAGNNLLTSQTAIAIMNTCARNMETRGQAFQSIAMQLQKTAPGR